jgi:hypothetical protein
MGNMRYYHLHLIFDSAESRFAYCGKELSRPEDVEVIFRKNYDYGTGIKKGLFGTEVKKPATELVVGIREDHDLESVISYDLSSSTMDSIDYPSIPGYTVQSKREIRTAVLNYTAWSSGEFYHSNENDICIQNFGKMMKLIIDNFPDITETANMRYTVKSSIKDGMILGPIDKVCQIYAWVQRMAQSGIGLRFPVEISYELSFEQLS